MRNRFRDQPPDSRSRSAAQQGFLALLLIGLMLVGGGTLGCASGIARSAARGDVDGVNAQLAAGRNIESEDWKGRSPLELAIILDRNEVLDLLITKGANVNRQGKGSRTPLIWASMQWGSPEVIHKLIEAGADPNGTDRSGQTPLLYSVLYGNLLQTQALIDGGADVNHYMTPKWKAGVLSAAIRQRKIEAVELLVASGADVDARNSKGMTAREQAARRPGMFYAIDHGLEKRKANSQLASAGAGTRSSPMPTSRKEAKPKVAIAPAPAPSPPAPAVTKKAVTATVVSPPIVARISPRRASKELRLGRYHALVIGNDDYDHLPKLRTAVNDANALSALLRDRYGYEVHTLLNATRSEILKALSKYRRILTSNDNLLI